MIKLRPTHIKDLLHIGKDGALLRLFANYQNELNQEGAPQSFQAFLEREVPEMFLRNEAWKKVIQNRLGSLRDQAEHIENQLNNHSYTSQTYPMLRDQYALTKNAIGELLEIMSIMQYLDFE